MTPSERVTYIRDIASKLGREKWKIMNLTLKEFDLPRSDDWSGKSTDYVIDMISSAEDDKIVNLGKHLGIIIEHSQARVPTFWQDHEPRIFISHVSSYKDRANATKTELRTFGINGFVAHEDIEPTKEWQDEIELALSTADALLVLLTSEFHKSNWTDQEVGFAVGRRIPIISVRVDIDPYGLFGKYQAFQGKGRNVREVCNEIFEILLQKLDIGAKITDSIASKLALSESFAEAKDNTTLLERCRYISAKTSRLLETALEKNSQVSGAYRVPGRIKEFLKKASS